MTPIWVLGLDACRKGWAGICWAGAPSAPAVGVFGGTVSHVVQAALERVPVEVIVIDIPIGLPDDSQRQADVLARRKLGPLASSVFATPVRAALAIEQYSQAAAVQLHRAGVGLSRQSYGLRNKILEVDEYRRRAPCRMVEAHPEVSFAEMNGGPLTARKKSWNGAVQRSRLLEAAGVRIEDRIGEVGSVAAVDDLHDAAAAAWTAFRVGAGVAACIPDPPERFADGWPAAIWA
jgi:predicted RNase H-like nuclease